MSTNTTTRFQQRYLVVWMVVGAVFSLLATVFIFIDGTSSGQSSKLSWNEIIMYLLAAPVSGTIIGPVWGSFGMLFEASTRYNWKFGEIEHYAWVWYIYPLYTIFDIIWSMTVGFLIYMVKSLLFR
ncbi:hypothetical protein PN499_10915 [Kamptonema animale CS-326]|jgi:hypothetical protein|uniref:hypothetical protein n=1 Tax=Kamptonema animale TaxID=92934 RepID=UPI00232FF7D1|nr:hypothetical protein [Kamptonema animale]MDB9511695.1 hypothetical protein [Kamptonema animale CS-326]